MEKSEHICNFHYSLKKSEHICNLYYSLEISEQFCKIMLSYFDFIPRDYVKFNAKLKLMTQQSQGCGM